MLQSLLTVRRMGERGTSVSESLAAEAKTCPLVAVGLLVGSVRACSCRFSDAWAGCLHRSHCLNSIEGNEDDT